MTIFALHALALLGYLAAAGLLTASLARGRQLAPRGGVLLIGLATLAHVAGLVAYSIRFEELPLVGLAPSLSTLALMMAVFLFLAALARDARPVGIVLLPVISLLLALALVLGIQPAGEVLAFRGVWFAFHVLLAFIGLAGFAFVFAAGLLYLLQFRELKTKRFGRLFRFFPPLHTLDALGRSAAVIGFCALSVAIALGWAWTIRFDHTLALRDPQVLWSGITWVAFAGVLGARVGGAGSDRRAALVSVVGFVIVVLSFVLLRAAMSGFHSLV